MEMTKRMEAAGRALERLREMTDREELSDEERDALIQRFEFCFEILWKCGTEYLLTEDGLDAASPKKVIRLLRETGVLDEEETEQALAMADDRNMTAHTYDESLAKEMSERIRTHAPLMREWHRRMMSGSH